MPATVNVAANRSSVVLYLPGVQGALDYRVFAVEDGVKVSVDGDQREHVDGATLHCAGLRQRNQCDDGARLPITYNYDRFDLPKCESWAGNRRPNVPVALMQTLEVNGIGANTTLVVEAIDRQCPFPGLFGSQHMDVKIAAPGADFPANSADVNVNGKPYSLMIFSESQNATCNPIFGWDGKTNATCANFPLRTEAEIRAQYGSMILNGQGPNMPSFDTTAPNWAPQSPYLYAGHPAKANDPVVLARSVINVSATGDATLPEGFGAQDYFDDFHDSTDQPVAVTEPDGLEAFGPKPKVYKTSKWYLYDVGNQFSNFFIDRGQLNMVMGDPNQDSMSIQAMYPKRPAQLPTDAGKYLHITYEVQRNETDRRYENLSLCGSDKMGDTYVGDRVKAAPAPKPNFMNAVVTTETNPFGWNCLQLVPRGGNYGEVPGGDIDSHSDTALNISVMASHPAPTVSLFNNDNESDAAFASPFMNEVAPAQTGDGPLYVRQYDHQHNLNGVWLDDKINVWQRARFDVFVRRDYLVIYVDGEQRACGALKGKAVLTMAEAAIGFWHVLYHSSAEFLEMRADNNGTANPATGQYHIMHNTPFGDQRSYDNVGFRENVLLPSSFDPARCFQ